MCMVSHSRQRLFTTATYAERTAVKAKHQPPHDDDRSTTGRLLRRRRLSLKKFRCSTAAVYTRIRPPCPVESAGPINTTSRLRVRKCDCEHVTSKKQIRGFSSPSWRFHCFCSRTFASTSSIACGVAMWHAHAPPIPIPYFRNFTRRRWWRGKSPCAHRAPLFWRHAVFFPHGLGKYAAADIFVCPLPLASDCDFDEYFHNFFFLHYYDDPERRRKSRPSAGRSNILMIRSPYLRPSVSMSIVVLFSLLFPSSCSLYTKIRDASSILPYEKVLHACEHIIFRYSLGYSIVVAATLCLRSLAPELRLRLERKSGIRIIMYQGRN